VFVVGPGNKAIQRTVTATKAIGTNWVVTSGINKGDKVIVQGVGKTLPNQVVKPVPASQPERIGPPQKGGNKTGGQGNQAGQTNG
jgi:membrane fusion protein (multidrug efflux system)